MLDYEREERDSRVLDFALEEMHHQVRNCNLKGNMWSLSRTMEKWFNGFVNYVQINFRLII